MYIQGKDDAQTQNEQQIIQEVVLQDSSENSQEEYGREPNAGRDQAIKCPANIPGPGGTVQTQTRPVRDQSYSTTTRACRPIQLRYPVDSALDVDSIRHGTGRYE